MSKSIAAAAALLLAALGACQSDKTDEYLAHPQVNDVLVVRFVPEGGTTEQFYFYQIFKLESDTLVHTHPAREPVAAADAEVRPGLFAPEATRTYTKRELQEYRQEDPGDKQHSRLVRVIRQGN